MPVDDSAPTEAPRATASTGGPETVLAPGAVLASRYEVGALLGRGGMGEVYAVHDLDLEEDIALKLLRKELSSDSAYRKRLRSEVRLARRVSHPNVCRVHDLGQHEDHLFVTMARVPGRSLRQLQRAIRAGEAPPLTLEAIVDMVSQLCAALGAAHAAGVLHRDIKPDNVMVDDGRVVLTDFGVAAIAGEGDGMVVGTPAYTAPELLRGEPCDGRADVYSATVVAYELIAGTTPFLLHSMRQAARLALDREPAPPLPPEIASGARHAALERVLRAGLASEPAERLHAPTALAEGLAGALRETADESAASSSASMPAATADVATVGTIRRRVEPRVATVLTFFTDESTGPETMDAAETLGTPDHVTGDALEHAVVDLGGWPVTLGSGSVTALFGVPTALGDDATRAVRAAQRLLATHKRGRAGIDTRRVMVRPDAGGPALAGVPRDVARTADALAFAAAPGQVWLSAAASRQVAGHVDVSPAGEVGGLRAMRVTGDARVSTAATGNVARARELARLEAIARTCFEQRAPRVVEVRGGHGLGKTRLRESFVARVAERREVEWLVACAAPLGEAAALSLVRSASPDWFDAASRLPRGASRKDTLAAARAWLDERASRRPVAILFDDLQWADEVSRALVAELATTLDALPVLVVVFTREAVELGGAEVIELGPLDDATALRVAREAAPAASDEALANVVARAGGNPFFVEELARELVERGDATGALPETVEAAVQARLERLSPVASDLLAAAAVVGRAFWREAARVAMPAPVGDTELDAALAELERRALAYPAPPSGPDDDRYELAHALVRDVAYQRLAPRERRQAHAAVARWLGAHMEGMISPNTPVTPVTASVRGAAASDPDLLWALAHHRELGGDTAGAAAAWRTAGLRSLELFAYHQAYGALRRARELAGGAGDPVLLERLGEAAFEADTLEAADEAYAAAVARTPIDDDVAQARLAFRRGQVASGRAEHAAAIEHYERGLALLAPGGELTPAARRDPRQAALLFGWLGWVRTYQLSNADPVGLAYCERAVELLEHTPHKRELAQALSRLGGAYMRAGRWDDQRRCNQRNLDIALELGDLQAQVTAHINLGVVLGNLGELALAIEHTERALALCRRAGARPTTGLALSNLAGYHLEQGDLERATMRLQEGIRVLESVGGKRILTESYQFLARLAARRGDDASARAAIEQSIALARAAANSVDVAIGLRIIAQLDARTGDLAAAEASLAEATRLCADADAFEKARLDAAAARLHDRAGRPEAAAAARERARDVFAPLGARVDLAALDDPDDIR